jgi:hypothetical protein
MRKTNSNPTEYKVTVTGRDRDGYVTCETGSFVADNLRDAKDMALSFTSLSGASVEKAIPVDDVAHTGYWNFTTIVPVESDDCDDDTIWSMF